MTGLLDVAGFPVLVSSPCNSLFDEPWFFCGNWMDSLVTHDGSMVLVYMLTWLGYIDGIYVAIYSSTMDPMGNYISTDVLFENLQIPRCQKAYIFWGMSAMAPALPKCLLTKETLDTPSWNRTLAEILQRYNVYDYFKYNYITWYSYIIYMLHNMYYIYDYIYI